jgi:hypothetical protein
MLLGIDTSSHHSDYEQQQQQEADHSRLLLAPLPRARLVRQPLKALQSLQGHHHAHVLSVFVISPPDETLSALGNVQEGPEVAHLVGCKFSILQKKMGVNYFHPLQIDPFIIFELGEGWLQRLLIKCKIYQFFL